MSEKQNVKSQINSERPHFFEELLRSGSQYRIVTNVVGPPGSGKSVLLYNYAAQVIEQDKAVLYVSLDKSSDQLLSVINDLSFVNTSKSKEFLTPVDGYSRTVGATPTTNLAFSAANLSEFSLTISEALKRDFECAIIDPLSTLFIHNDEPALIKALQIIMAKLRSKVSLSFLSFEEGVHSNSFYHTLRFLADINLILRRDETEKGEVIRALHVHSSKGFSLDEQWFPFSIDKDGRVNWYRRSL